VAASYDGAVFQLLVNGALEASLPLVKKVGYTSSGWTFGSNLPIYYSNGGQYTRTFNGVIDELQAFSRALSPAELLSIFNAGSAGECKNTSSPLSVNAFGTVNNASFAPGSTPLAPGTIAAVFGTNLDDGSMDPFSSFGADGKLGTSLGGASVTFSGVSNPVPIFSAFPQQLNVEIPSGPKPPGPGAREWTGSDLQTFIMLSVYTGLRISDVATFNIRESLERALG